ncbi:succinyldiaminopimelate transaminase [Leucothrix pacifica]|uniref:Succinyldiaminopimelate transaminase n=1 Tax=Leucothrix pacifica TaxID=1247513 RepID=A0A317C8D9_9GAMM|nr:succinyldiaminopimelate transaminase [Leucothrix pacifica]PWQ94925.1 succinyldiaminopimelate transaminase [Leucothrix pacifica]
MNSDLQRLQPYPFEKLAILKQGVQPNPELSPLSLSIGEPKHPTPAIILDSLKDSISQIAQYPGTKGIPALREAIADWLIKRFNLPEKGVNPDTQILPVNGTREALFAITQCLIERKPNAKVLMPNPFYQIYEGATLLAGATPVYLPSLEENNFLPDLDAVDEKTWQDCQLFFLCTPDNPTGAVTPISEIKKLLALAEKYDFVIASDECYSEIYLDESSPPPGLLQVAASVGNTDYNRCLVFHSLSKRSNAPGLRSGFVAGDAEILKSFLLYRTYHGCAMPPHTQTTSIVAWGDETHVQENRRLYREKFKAVLEILSPVMEIPQPQASFYLWAKTPIDDVSFTRDIFERENLNVVPGSYLSREVDGLNPGADRIRLALVAEPAQCIEAAQRIKHFIESL